MNKIILLSMIMVSLLLSYDFGNVPEKRLDQVPKGAPAMVMVGKTKCIWCESMAPWIKETKEQYPKSAIYYVNVDNDPLGAINHNISELPVQLFFDANGKEIGRHIGYLNREDLLAYLDHYGVISTEP